MADSSVGTRAAAAFINVRGAVAARVTAGTYTPKRIDQVDTTATITTRKRETVVNVRFALFPYKQKQQPLLNLSHSLH